MVGSHKMTNNRKLTIGAVVAIAIVIVISTSLTMDEVVLPSTMKQPDRHIEMIRIANKIRKHSKTVLVGVINNAYLPLAYSWLCNTKEMGIHNKILFITTDDQTSLKLKQDWPEVSVASMNISDLGGDREFGQAGYLRVNVKRHQYIYQLLAEGFELLHFEVDCVWLKNPLPYLQSQVGYDLLVNAVSGIKDYNSGFVYIFNTEKSIKVWQLLAQRMTDLAQRISGLEDKRHVNSDFNDQPFWSEIIFNRVPGLNLKVLTLDKFADGQWYNKNEADRNATEPYIINNNWIVGNKNKIERAKKWNQWFLDENMKCNMDQIHRTVQKQILLD